MRKASVGEVLGAAEIDPRDVRQICEPREHRIGHLTAGVQARDLLLRHHGDDLAPFSVVERVAT